MKKHDLKTLACIAAFIALPALSFVSCEEDEKNSLKGIQFDEDEIELAIGDEYDLSEILWPVPEKAELPRCTYESDDKTVATVGKSTGKVKAVAAGEALITVETSDGKHYAECLIIVTSGGQPGAGYNIVGSLEYSEAASWSNVSASFDEGRTFAVTAPIANKGFNLTLTAPATNLLHSLSDALDESINVSPTSASGLYAFFYARRNSQSNDLLHIGYNSNGNPTSIMDYIYVDRNVSVTGTRYYSDGKDVYNLQLKAGWNVVINTWNYTSSNYDDFYNTGNIPSPSAWFMDTDLSSTSAPVSAGKAGEKPVKFGALKTAIGK